jgi:hypothetical protein
MTVPEGFCCFHFSTKTAARKLETDAARGLESIWSNAGMNLLRWDAKGT